MRKATRKQSGSEDMENTSPGGRNKFLVCFKRIKASAGRAVPTTSTRRHSEVDRDSVLQLCADLYDQESAVLQYKVLKYLQEKTHAQGGLLLLMAPDSTQLTCQVLNGKMLEEEMRFPVEQNGFGSIFHLKTACMLSDLQPDLREELNEIIGVTIQSLLCVPLFNKVTGDAQALVFMLNKTGADSFTEEDVEIIQYCFKYTATVLTSALAIQNERRLKVQTQELLRVTKNLFTHLGEYSHRGVHPFPLQSLHEAETPTPLPPAPCVSETHWANSKTSTPIAHVCDKLKHVKHDTHRQVNREARLGSACLAIVGDTDSHMVKTEAVARMVHLQHPKCPGKCFGLPTVCEKPIVKEHSSSSVTGACSLKLDLSSSQLEPKIPLADEGFVNQPVAACSSNLQCREPVRSTSSTSNSSTSLPSRGRSAESVCSDIREVLNTAFLESESETSTCGELTSHPSHTSVKVYTDNLSQNEKHGACVVVIENAEENFCHQPEPVKTGDMLSGNGVKKQIAKIQVLGEPENGILSVGTVDKLCLASQQQQTLDVEWYRDAICILCPGPWNENVPEENQYDLTVLLREIMQTARNLAKAERCSVFLLENDTNELVAKVFDGGADDKLQAEIRIPVTQGIAGHVATTGEILNIKDAYSHPLFYRGVDESTGFRTRNILCFPIKDETGENLNRRLKVMYYNSKCNIVGVAQLCNKIKAPYFTAFDEEIANAFSIYCCISLVHSLLYKKVRDAQTRSKLSNELMIYHMLVSPEEIFRLACQNIPAPHVFDTSMDKFCCMPRSISEPDSPLAVLSMFQDMNLISRFKVQTKTLAKFTLMVKKGYRDPPYHNWGHAFAVAHFCYLAYKNLKLLNYITELEVFALFTACLCHDIDHRGTNNSYQVASGSVLAALYSSEGSVMERHHFAQSMCILNTEGCNIFENLTRQEYQRVLDLVRDIILATDLAHHLRILKELRAMVDGGFDKDNPQHHMLVCFLLMTACDLSDQTKSWRNSKKIAELIYGEFFSQGDLEKALGQKPLEMMDRERAYIPDLQLGFLDGIALPVFQLLAKLMPGAQEVLDAVLNNKRMWMKVDTKIQQSNCENKSSVDVFSMEIDEGEDDTVNVET